MDFNLVDLAAEQAATQEAQENECAEYLFASFDWEGRTAEVEEALSMNADALTAAHTRFIRGYGLELQLLFNSAAMTIVEGEAKQLVSIHGDNWLLALENEL
jgi:hypothetical protein